MRSRAWLVVLALVSGCSAGGPTGTAAASPLPTPGSPGAATASASASPSAPPATTRAAGPAACTIFPADNVWHADVSRLPVHRDSAAYVASIGTSRGVHADF